MGAILKTATPGLALSEAYLQSLGFTRVSETPALFTDGSALVEVDPDRFARPGIVLHRDDWGGILDDLVAHGPLHPMSGGRMIAAPSGTWVYLMDGPFSPPSGVATAPPSALGKYAGVSLETPRIDASLAFWQRLGFTKSAGDPAQGWVSLADTDGFSLSLMKPFACPHLFFNPSLTYFNSGRNPEVIAELRRRGVPLAEEVTAFNDRGEVDNVVLRDPGGLGFFVFND